MARKTAMYSVKDENRDRGKMFLLTEMDADKAEDWAMRVFFALMSANVELPDGIEELGMAGLAEIGLKAIGGLKWEIAKPLVAEMFECVQMIPDPSKTHVQRSLVPSDIEEVSTRLKLRMEVFNLHVDFSGAGVLSAFLGKGTPAGKGRVTKTSAK